MTELLVGTRKGLFVLEGEPGAEFEPAVRAFAGEPVEYAMRTPAGLVLASVTSPFYGPKIFYAEDPAGDWEQAEGVSLPESGDAVLERVWVVVPGEEDGLVFAAYFLWCWLRGGQTLAMRAWHIKLVDVTPPKALLRLLLAGILLPVSIVWALFDRERQFLHDRLAGTRLLSTR